MFKRHIKRLCTGTGTGARKPPTTKDKESTKNLPGKQSQKSWPRAATVSIQRPCQHGATNIIENGISRGSDTMSMPYVNTVGLFLFWVQIQRVWQRARVVSGLFADDGQQMEPRSVMMTC